MDDTGCLKLAALKELIMQWLSQYGIWILLAVGAYFLYSRRGQHRRGGFGNDSRYDNSHGAASDGAAATSEGTAVDPVTGKSIPTSHAVTSYYQGRIFYFETPESRQRFEETPEKYANVAAGISAPSEHHHHRHGC